MAVMGLLPPHAALVGAGSSVLFEGREVLHQPAAARRAMCGKDMAMIFQEPMSSLNPVFTVGFQIGEVLRRHLGMGRRPPARARWNCWRRSASLTRRPGSMLTLANCPAASSA